MVFIVLLWVSGTGVEAGAATVTGLGALTDTFYQQPDEKVAAAQAGEILASRKVALESLLSGHTFAPWSVDSWQIAYRSNNTWGQPITAVATLIKPRGTAASPRKLLSVNVAEDATAQYCAPSFALQYGNAWPTTLVGNITLPLHAVFIQPALDQGMAVVIPDDEGPNSALSAGRLAGQITLDGIRAATHFSPLEAQPGTPVGLIGYSGGAIGVSHASEMAASYAPDLNIVGAAEGGVMADLEAALDQSSGTITSGVSLAGVVGMAREYPALADELERIATPDVKALLKVKQPFCVGWQTATLPFFNLKRGVNYQGSAVSQQIFDQERLGRSVPRMPLFIWQSKSDEFFPIRPLDEVVGYYCRDPGATVEYARDGVPEHILAAADGAGTAVEWVIDRLNGVATSPGCHIRDVNSLRLDR